MGEIEIRLKPTANMGSCAIGLMAVGQSALVILLSFCNLALANTFCSGQAGRRNSNPQLRIAPNVVCHYVKHDFYLQKIPKLKHNMRTTLIVLFATLSNFSYSQNITFDQAQNLRTKSLAEIETFLNSKSWSMTEAKEASGEEMAVATFGFDVDQFDSNKASGWIMFFESSTSKNYNRLLIQIHKSSLYSTFLSRLSPNGYKLKSSKIVDGSIKKIYANTTTTCIVTTATSEGTFSKSTVYSFYFMDNLSYNFFNPNEE